MLCDYHIHSKFSSDGRSSLEEYVKAAVENGVDELCFTEHIELDIIPPACPALDIEGYLAATDALTRKYAGVIDVKRGVEVSLGDAAANERTNSFLAPYMGEIDVIIGSTHAMNDYNEKDDPFFPEFFDGLTKNQAYQRYFERILHNITQPNAVFDVMGHYDYVGKNAPYEDRRVMYDQAPYMLDEIFKAVIANGVCIEINTGPFKREDEPLWGLDVLKRYAQLGGEYVSVGSDAHSTLRLGARISDALALAKAAGISYVATFSRRKPQLHKL